MPTLSWVMYDTVIFGTTANVVHTAFVVQQGGAAGKGKEITNMIGPGELPAQNSMEINRIGVSHHDGLVLADIEDIWDETYLELFINNQTYFISPLRLLANRNGYGGHYSQAAAADEFVIGLLGDGYELPVSIIVPSGTQFKVEVKQGPVMAANTNVLISLYGKLTRPQVG